MINWKERLWAAGIHFGISLAIAALAALLVFGLWYPYPYREISGGRELFLIVVTVDVILGPLITLAVFNRKKSLRELRLDLGVVAFLQLTALAYGLWTVSLARPVHLVFEIDRFRVVHRVEVADELLHLKPAGLHAFPLLGPTLLSVRAFKDPNEKIEATLAALRGLHLSLRPDLWESYESAKPRVLSAAKPVADLRKRFPARAAEVDEALRGVRKDPQAMLYLPMIGRKTFWTAFIDPATAEVVAFLPLDPF